LNISRAPAAQLDHLLGQMIETGWSSPAFTGCAKPNQKIYIYIKKTSWSLASGPASLIYFDPRVCLAKHTFVSIPFIFFFCFDI